jgi:protein ImuB
MDRLACVDVPELPLQLLHLRQPSFAAYPAAVVEADRPQGKLLWVNEKARALRILPGMSYAEGLAISVDLRASTVSEHEIALGVTDLTRALRTFSPEVEPSDSMPGIFWLNASGLGRMYASASSWGRSIVKTLKKAGFESTVVIGFNRFAAYASARSHRGVIAFATPEKEQAAMRAVPLSRLATQPAARDVLGKLNVHTVGDFLELPARAVGRRFGPEIKALHDFASQALFAPFAPKIPEDPVTRTVQLEPPDGNAVRTLFLIRRTLHPMLAELAGRHQALAGLTIEATLVDLPDRVETLKSAEPTLDLALATELARLRLEARPFDGAASEITLTAEGAPAETDQLLLFFSRPKRDLKAGNRALARLRAELGPDAVVCARIKQGHLPENGFAWEPLMKLRFPDPHPSARPWLTRRIESPPKLTRLRPNKNGHDVKSDVRLLWGPYVLSGGWWHGEVHRAYFFAKNRLGRLLWLFYDGKRRRWFSHGGVE